eukprot:GFUD01007697.1.p1 GENE.GFUD01007697.1~~GFUD01007697.1.p1  ORF type:complete len:277 (+),score=36.65 GFUD01007697.1:37-867(+)
MGEICIDNSKRAKTKIFNWIFISLIFTSFVLVFTGLGIWIVNKDARVASNRAAAEKMPLTGEVDKDTGKCDQLEYRFKHFRLLKKMHIATIYFLNGDRYYGEVWEQKLRINEVSRYVGVEGEKRPDGWGEMEYTNGSRYTGQWAKGVRDGCGVIVKKGYLSTRYSGTWKQDKQTGYGEMIYSNGASYHGQWVNNLYHGHGVLAWANGDAYNGDFLYGSMHGQGVFTYYDGSRYSGHWAQGHSIGAGKLFTAKGSCFQINWREMQPKVYNGENCKDI